MYFMFCQKCGKEIPDDSTFCSGCGAQANMAQPSGGNSSFGYYANQAKQEVQKYNIWAIVGFIVAVVPFVVPLGMFSLITGISALVMSIYAANQIKVTGEKGNVFAILGIIFGSLFILYGILCVLMLVGLLGAYGFMLNYLIEPFESF